MRTTPRSNRPHIAIFGKRNVGKSSLLNAVTGQDVSLVSAVAGTTTDPVWKAMEILPLGPVVFIDTAGLDDRGQLGELRVERTRRILERTDLALLVIEAGATPGPDEEAVVAACAEREVPVLGVASKCDLAAAAERPGADLAAWAEGRRLKLICVSAVAGDGVWELREAIAKAAPDSWEGPPLLGDLLAPGDIVVLVTPIDLEAPKGRLILPQVQALRDALDHDTWAVVVRENRLPEALAALGRRPALVVTDSQAFGEVARDTPADVPLTSFSILFARHKGDLATLVAGAAAVDTLRPGDAVLVAESCTHHPIGDDIGRVKIPQWLGERAGGELDFTWAAGADFPADLDRYRLIVHCGACMFNRRTVLSRLHRAGRAGAPVVNYGVLIAHVHGILKRALAPFPGAYAAYDPPAAAGEGGRVSQ